MSSAVDASENSPLSRRFAPSRRVVRAIQFALDLSALTLAFGAAYLLRFEFQLSPEAFADAKAQLPMVVGIQSLTLLLFGVYRFIWRYVGMAEIRTFVASACASSLPILILRLVLPASLQAWRVPLSIIVVDAILAFGGVLGLRVLRRTLFEFQEKQERAEGADNPEKKPALLVGAGRAGVLAAREISSVGDMALEVKGFVDDDPAKQGSVIQGFPVLGTTEDLPRLVREMGIEKVVIAIARISRREILRIIDICHKIPVKLRIIPGLYQIIQGKVQVSRIRNVQISDLLGREPVELDEEQVGHFLAGRTIMVTGAGGSIGSELARQVARFKPEHLLLVERAEFALFEIDQELRRSFPELSIHPLVADVGEEPRIRSIFETYRPHVVLHAAAHKHVPMMESNPAEAIKNNILATRNLGEISGDFGVEAFVMISTAKAVRPTSVMGASKRVAELAVQDLQRRHATRYVAVRFGNVIGSAGSVVPIFREQIRRGGPVTVTHPDMRRYFMTIPEAAQLVLQAGAMGEGGEIFILDMGEPVRILDLAVAMITLTGLKPFEEMDIVFTGLRPGEKLYEELELFGEDIAKTRHPKIFIGKLGSYSSEEVERALRRLAEFARDGNNDETRRFLNSFLPEAKLSVRRETRERQPKAEGATSADKARPYA
jgi:FlaA1/EpsC-like NDP-sugar epimerase